METFIVRIYRGTPACAQELAGTVERVGMGDRAGFFRRPVVLDRLLAPRRRGDDERHPRADNAAEPGEGT